MSVFGFEKSTFKAHVLYYSRDNVLYKLYVLGMLYKHNQA